MKAIHASLAIIIILFSNISNAQDFKWSGSPTTTPQFDSPDEVCRFISANYNLGGGLVAGSGYASQKQTDQRFLCDFRTNPPRDTFYQGSSGIRYYAQRTGTACPSGTEYNSDTGRCDPPFNPCEAKVGLSDPFRKTGQRDDGFYDTVKINGKTIGITPDSGCFAGCTALLNQSCVFTISTNTYSCSGNAYYSGQQCTVDSTSIESSPTPTQEDPQVVNDKQPCVYSQNEEGKTVCTSRQTVEHQGQNCGQAGPSGSEQLKCFPKEAKKDDSSVQTEVTQTSTPDGGTETVKNDVYTETKCLGTSQNCVTSVTTTTTITKTDSSGNTTSTTVNCKGAKCGEDGTGQGSGNGSGSGSSEEGDGEGDLPTNEGAPSFGESLDGFYSKISSSPIANAVNSISFPSGGSCNMPSANVYMLGTISFDWFCENANILDGLYYVMLGIWALGAIRLFLEA